MTRQEALDFLRSHQPMPPTDQLTDADAAKYDEARRYFLENPEVPCITLFLNSFGEGDCFGVYQLVEDVLAMFSSNEVVPHLAQSLRSPHRSVRYWCAQIASRFPAKRLIGDLEMLLNEKDPDTRYVAVTALEQIGGERVKEILLSRRDAEDDEELVALIDEVLNEL